ncbi:hypothetical protein CDAR_549501 [Caerostris darwini]|uniref:Uncharacterized protein n=1 Tax=Caerostris darwini TaxID=1538125 RepID=A0AAV4PFR7_9ARAC|nr:hypothetical protein CDAR_549501 [Caerostris darwini]
MAKGKLNSLRMSRKQCKTHTKKEEYKEKISQALETEECSIARPLEFEDTHVCMIQLVHQKKNNIDIHEEPLVCNAQGFLLLATFHIHVLIGSHFA